MVYLVSGMFSFLLCFMQTHLFIDRRKRARLREGREEDRQSWGNGGGREGVREEGGEREEGEDG